MDYAEASRLKAEGKPLKDIMELLGCEISYKGFQKNLWRYENKVEKNNIVYEDKKPQVEFDDVEEYYSLLKALNNKMSDMDTKQTKMTVEIKDNKPIAIAHWGDWHIGGRGVDYEQFDIDRELIKGTDGLYFIGMGDYKDNQLASIHAAGTHEEIMPSGMQDLLVKHFMEDVKDKCIALIRGCHDDWDKKLTDKDFISTLCEVSNSVNLWHGGGINVKLGNQTYKIRARHKFVGSSQLNTTNSQRRLLDMYGECDIMGLRN